MNGQPRRDHETLRTILGALALRVGLRADRHVRDVVDAALRAMALRGRTDLASYVGDLATGREPPDAWIDEVVVGETYFFRDLPQLEHAARAVVAPVAFGTSAAHPIRVWSAGCASGEEAHSLAVLLLELGLAGRATVLGTDVSPASLAKATAGVYGAFSLRGAQGDRMRPYVTRAGDRHRVRDDVRAFSIFRRGNLATEEDDGDPPPGTMTLVACRNVLLYFTPEAVDAAAARFARSLAPGGWLLTAPADPPLSAPGLERVPGLVGVYEKVAAPSHHGLPPVERFASMPPAPPPPAPTPEVLAASPAVPAAVTAAHEPTAKIDAGIDAGADADDPSHPAYHHHRALVLLEAGDVRGALEAARRVTYLAPELAMAHYTLALVALREGSTTLARRSYREAVRLARAAPPDRELALGGGLRAADVARASSRQLARLEVAP